MLKHQLVFEGSNPDSVAECVRYAGGGKIEPTNKAIVDKPKGVLIKPWVEHNKARSKTFNVTCTHIKSR